MSTLFEKLISTKTEADILEVNYATKGIYDVRSSKTTAPEREPVVTGFEPEFIKRRNNRPSKLKAEENRRYNQAIDEALALARPRKVEQPVKKTLFSRLTSVFTDTIGK